MPRHWPNNFQVAFSFAGEERELVKQIATVVEEKLGYGTVFYDEWFEHVITGRGADLVLQKIYHERSKLVVVCISRQFGSNPWTRVEHEAIRARDFSLPVNTDDSARLRILEIRVGDGDVPGILPTTIYFDAKNKGVEATARLILDRLALIEPPSADSPQEQSETQVPAPPIEFDTGMMSVDSRWYVEREVDKNLYRYLSRRGRTVALKGGRGMGNSSLAARMQKKLQDDGYRAVWVDVRDDFSLGEFQSESTFFVCLEADVGKQLGLSIPQAPAPGEPDASPGFREFLRKRVFPQSGSKILLVFDRIDYLFDKTCCGPVLSRLRRLHNEGANPPFDLLRMLLIHNIKPAQLDESSGSVFDVARTFEIEDFTAAEVGILNDRHSHLISNEEVQKLYKLLGGHPALTRMAFNAVAEGEMELTELLDEAQSDGGIFQEHLRPILKEFQKPPNRQLANEFRNVVAGKGCSTEEQFELLLALGVVKGSYHCDAVPRCDLYAAWLPKRLPKDTP